MSLNNYYGKRGAMADINVTPLVDVILVLLIIFMVTAPMMQRGVAVDLPKTEAGELPAEEEKLVITIQKDRIIYLNNSTIPFNELEQRLQSIVRLRQDKEVFLRADAEVPYGFVVQTMALIRKAGISKLGMITELPEIKR
jgi:biopolymer transport protein TolR